MPGSTRLGALLWIPLCSALIAVGSLIAASGEASADSYEVEVGDTLSGIASCFNVSTSVLQALNPSITSPNAIYAGQRIEIPDNAESGDDGCSGADSGESDATPTTGQSTPAPLNSDNRCTYQVRPGDILSLIAHERGVDTETMISLNPGIDPNVLWVDYTLSIPCSASAADPQDGAPASQALTAGVRTDDTVLSGVSLRNYIVEAGDSASAIADQFGISLDELREHNPQANLDLIHTGDTLNIPVPAYLAPALEPSEALGILTTTYTVRSGDYASGIAERYGIGLDDLRRLNSGSSLNTIRIGQTLSVPWTGPSPDAAPGTVPAVDVRRRTYRVQLQDTFQSIAWQHNLTMDELRELNRNRPTDHVVIGQLLYLPGTIDPPPVAEERTLWEADLVQYAAATLGVTPHTLLANHGWVEPGQWLGAGTSWRLPLREGLLVTVQPGDTLQGIANAHGVDMALILADPANGVEDPNAIVIGQEIILPLVVPDFDWPARGEMTDPFGLCRSWDCSYRHRGLDLALDLFEPIVAAADGVVTFVGGDAAFGLGHYVEVEHGHGWTTTYAHLVDFAVWEGQQVDRGDIIGYNGNTGYSTGPHLHFEVHHNDWYVDPLVVLP